MAEIVSSALVHETVGQIISNLVQKYEDKDESSANRNLERIEMAHIRLEAALEKSEKWQISEASLLRWRGKLKRAAQECDETLHRCKQRILPAEQTEETDGNAVDDDFFSLMLQLSESTDIVGMAIQCLQLYAPLFNFKSAVETVRNKLMQLPTEDLSWVPDIDTRHKEHWDILHRFGTDWFRPNPLCCKQHDQYKLCHGSRKSRKSRSPDVFLEPVIEVHLQCHVSVLDCNQHRSFMSETKYSVQDSPYLKVGLLFAPHGCLEDILHVDRTPAIPAMYSEEQNYMHTDFTLGQLEETMLPKAIDYFCKNDEAAVYQMLWKLKHGAAYIQVEKESMGTQRTSMRTFLGPCKGKMLQWHDQEIGRQASTIFQFLNLWVAHAPVQLQGTIVDWIQKEKDSQLAALQLHHKF